MAAAAAFLNKAVKPVLVGGVKMRAAHALAQFKELADASRFAVAVMPNAKGWAPYPTLSLASLPTLHPLPMRFALQGMG